MSVNKLKILKYSIDSSVGCKVKSGKIVACLFKK